jgi:predicted nuclease with TOPRIM domain
MRVAVEVSPGEAVDRVVILELKLRHLPEAYHAEIREEIDQLKRQLERLQCDATKLVPLVERLRRTNATLWETEERLREYERNQNFGSQFVNYARGLLEQ